MRALQKDVGEVRWFTMDWSLALTESDTIATSVWVIPTGLTLLEELISTDGRQTRIKVSGGAAGHIYLCQNTIVTNVGEETFVSVGPIQVKTPT